jgi:hypothetical protein
MVLAQMPVVLRDALVSTRLPLGMDTRPAVAGMVGEQSAASSQVMSVNTVLAKGSCDGDVQQIGRTDGRTHAHFELFVKQASALLYRPGAGRW